MPVKKDAWGEKEKEGGTGCSLGGDLTHWVLCLEAFISFSQAGVLGEISGEDFNRIFISCPGVPYLGSWSPLIGQWQGRGSLVRAVGPGVTHLVLLLFWAWG